MKIKLFLTALWTQIKKSSSWFLYAGALILSLFWIWFVLSHSETTPKFSVNALPIETLKESSNNDTKTSEQISVSDSIMPEIMGAADTIIDRFSIEETDEDVEEISSEANFLVIRVVDGDTFDAEGLGRVRMIGVDTPETVDPRKTVQCFGVEASSVSKNKLLGRKVQLAPDATQGETDKYGRYLHYVYLEDGTFYNLWLIANGYAHEYTYNTPYQYQNEFKDAENQARLAKKGLWADNACDGDNLPVMPPAPAGSCVIKGNINSSGEKIYHLPGGAYYEKTQINEARGERWFCTEAEAQAAGWRKSKV